MSDVFSVHAACLRGVEAHPVTVEVSMSGGIPGIQLVGQADPSVQDARSRIRCALRAHGFEIPRKNITVNLSPGDMRKSGSGFDLPIAVAILAATEQIPRGGLDSCLFVGEIALDGSILPVQGEVAYALLARASDLTLVSGPGMCGIPLDGLARGSIGCLGDLRSPIAEARDISRMHEHQPQANERRIDYADVAGQEMAKRALVVAATGELGLMMVGAPGSGKSMLAERMPTILPPLEDDELQEALCVHSVMGEPVDSLLARVRPFRSPHHSISMAGLIGGGRPVRPGEASLAHTGVLFLDELGEFSMHTLQTLRQPIEQGCVKIVRAEGAYTFPARFKLLAASNPCPCGYLGDREIPCKCSINAIEKYQAKLRGPLADRIDMIVDIMRPEAKLIVEGAHGASSASMRQEVERGRTFREWRRRRRKSASRPQAAGEDVDSVLERFAFEADGRDCLLELSVKTHLTGRGIARLCRIARTVADLEEREGISGDHVLEASMFQGRRDGSP